MYVETECKRSGKQKTLTSEAGKEDAKRLVTVSEGFAVELRQSVFQCGV